MSTIKTYQDLQKIRENEQDTMEFILTVISEHKTSDLYRISEKAGQYYRHLNPTIMAAQKIVYDMLGRAQVDKYAKNNKRCPIEEHYALPKDGFCHLWEKRNITDDDYPERRTDG